MPVNVKGQRIGVAQPQATNLMIIPAKALDEGHTYVVALRRLRNASGRVLKAPAWFARLRDGRRLLRGERSQRSRYARIFAALSRAGIGRRSLHEAWDFTVGSQKSLTSRLLSIRNRAFAQLGDRNLADGKVRSRAPSYRITSITSLTPQLRHIQGTLQVPCYLVTCGSTATTAFHYRSGKADALPTQIPGDVATELRHAQLQISRCLQPNGSVVNVCGGKPCHSYNCTP
jgi:hypothetical protein